MILRGKVISGRGVGAELGYPTANIKCKDCPASGVYAARVNVDGTKYKSAAVAQNSLVEVLLFEFEGDLYSKELEVEILKKVSEIEKFDNQKDLIKKIKADIKLCLQE